MRFAVYNQVFDHVWSSAMDKLIEQYHPTPEEIEWSWKAVGGEKLLKDALENPFTEERQEAMTLKILACLFASFMLVAGYVIGGVPLLAPVFFAPIAWGLYKLAKRFE